MNESGLRWITTFTLDPCLPDSPVAPAGPDGPYTTNIIMAIILIQDILEMNSILSLKKIDLHLNFTQLTYLEMAKAKFSCGTNMKQDVVIVTAQLFIPQPWVNENTYTNIEISDAINHM